MARFYAETKSGLIFDIRWRLAKIQNGRQNGYFSVFLESIILDYNIM